MRLTSPCALAPQLDDDALIEEADKQSEADAAAGTHQNQDAETILGSPEVANRRTALMEKIHELASHTAHGEGYVSVRKE